MEAIHQTVNRKLFFFVQILFLFLVERPPFKKRLLEYIRHTRPTYIIL